eukprot:1154202-Pelagomonas_calceolata.AAC.6
MEVKRRAAVRCMAICSAIPSAIPSPLSHKWRSRPILIALPTSTINQCLPYRINLELRSQPSSSLPSELLVSHFLGCSTRYTMPCKPPLQKLMTVAHLGGIRDEQHHHVGGGHHVKHLAQGAVLGREAHGLGILPAGGVGAQANGDLDV